MGLRVCHIAPSFHPAYYHGGPTESVFRLCTHLARTCEIRVLTTNANGPRATLEIETDREIEIAPGVHCRYAQRRFSQFTSPAMLRELPGYVRWADVVHVTGVYSFPTPPSLLISKLRGKPLVWSPRGSLQRWEGTSRPWAKWLWEAACGGILPARTRLHVTSEAEAQESLHRYPGLRVENIPNGVDVPDTFVRTPSSGVLRLLYLGRLDPKKGIENLFHACRILADERSLAWSLTVVGEADDPSYERSLRDLVSRLDLSASVRMVGPAYGDAKRKRFEESDLVVVPSHTENFGMVVAEALAQGVPVVASTGTPWSGLETEACGLHVPNDPGSLARAVQRMASLPLAEMGVRGRRWMLRDFGWGAVSSRMDALYREVVAAAS